MQTIKTLCLALLLSGPLFGQQTGGGQSSSAPGSGTVSSVTLTGDGTVVATGPSAAVTTSGTLNVALANAASGTVLANNTGVAATPSYTTAIVLGLAGTSTGQIDVKSSGSATNGLRITDASIITVGTNEPLLLTPNGTGAIIAPIGTATNPSIQLTGMGSTTGLFGNTTTFCWSSAGTSTACDVGLGVEVSSAKGFLLSSTTAATGTPDITICRISAGLLEIGASNVCANSGLLQLRRLNVTGGTTLVAGDFVLSAGWGSTASIAITVTTSRDAAAVVTITTGGSGIAANPTIAFTDHDGTWTNSPARIALQTGGNDIFGDVTTTARSATAQTWQWNATPTTAKTYEFTIHTTGT